MPTERALLNGAAVAGEPFDPDLAAAVAGLPEDVALVALDALLALDLVRATSVPRLFVFRHPLVRRAVYETVPAGRRLAAHARAADSLAERGAPAAERAHHVAQSARPGRRGGDRLLLGVGAAATGRAPAAAARWYEEALRLLTESDRERQIDVRIALASALSSLGEVERSRAFLLEAVDLLPAERSLQQVELTASIAAAEHSLGRHDEAQRASRAPGRSCRTARRRRRPSSRSSWPWTGSTSRLRADDRDGNAGAGDRACRGGCIPDRRGSRSPVPRRDGRRPHGASARTARGGAPRGRPPVGRRPRAPPRGPALSRVGRELPGALRRLGRPRAARGGDRARHGRGAAAHVADARPELRHGDARPARRSVRDLRLGGRDGEAVGKSARALSRALRARVDAVLRGRSRRRHRGARGVRAASIRGWPAARSRTGAAGLAGASASRCSRPARSSADARSSSTSVATRTRARCPSSAATTGRA